jgi:CDP-4-dehydro-6-deoxyglucose reductase
MLTAYLRGGGDQPITLIYGVRYEESLLYRNEFEELERRHPNFDFLPTLSRPDEGWTGRRGHVQAHVIEALGDRRDMDVYICGLKLMVDDVRGRLKELGLDRKQIVSEKYD